MPESRAAKTIREIQESGRPLAYIRTAEEQRVATVLAALPQDVWTWTLTEGLRRASRAAEPGTESPRAALDFIAAHPPPPSST